MMYDVILIDTNYFMYDINLVTLDLSDRILYVINKDPVCLKTMKTMNAIYNDLEKNNHVILLNSSITDNKLSLKYISEFINYDIKYYISKDFYIENINEFVNRGKILTLDSVIRKKHKKTLNVFEKLAQDLLV